MFRLYILCFRGESRLSHEAEHHLHESPPSMIGPLVVLAALSIVGGWVGPPFQAGGNAFQRWLAPVFEAGGAAEHGHEVSMGLEWMLIVLSVAVAVVGIALAFRAYLQQPSLATALRERLGAGYRLLSHKYWIAEIYDGLIVRPIHRTSERLWRFWDEKVVDGTVNGVGYLFEGASAVLRLFQTGFVGTYALFFTLGVIVLVTLVLRH